MAMCKSYILVLFWKMISTVLVLGIFFGLCVVPVVLTIVDGDWGKRKEKEEEEEGRVMEKVGGHSLGDCDI